MEPNRANTIYILMLHGRFHGQGVKMLLKVLKQLINRCSPTRERYDLENHEMEASERKEEKMRVIKVNTEHPLTVFPL